MNTSHKMLAVAMAAILWATVPMVRAENSGVQGDEASKLQLLSILKRASVDLQNGMAVPKNGPAINQLAGPGLKSYFRVPQVEQGASDGQLKAPYAFELSTSQDESTFYSLFTAVDLTRYGTTGGCDNPPNVPSNPNPPNNAQGIATSGISLEWQGGDPDASDSVSYDIYFGRNNPPSLDTSGWFQERFSLNRQLDGGTTYYWKIVATDTCPTTTDGPVWKFTTGGTPPPPSPTPTPSPSPTTPGPSGTPTMTPTLTPTAPPNPPAVPVLHSEPEYTQGSENEVCWDAAQYASFYWLEWSLNSNFSSTMGNSGWLPETELCYTVTGLPQGQPIFYRVKAKNSLGESAWSNVVSSTQDSDAPDIRMAGYGDFVITQTEGGTFQLVAWVVDNVANSQVTVEIYLNGQPQGVTLPMVDQDIYLLQASIGPGDAAPGRYLLELAATDEAGNKSTLWPYFTIKGSSTTASQGPGKAETFLRDLQLMAASGIEIGKTTVNEETRKQLFDWNRFYNEAVRSTTRQVGDAPSVYAAGYWDTDVSTTLGGQFTIASFPTDKRGPANIQAVELYFNSVGTGVFLNDRGQSGDLASGDGIWAFGTNLQPLPPSSAGQFALELVATNFQGLQSTLWPYLTIGN